MLIINIKLIINNHPNNNSKVEIFPKQFPQQMLRSEPRVQPRRRARPAVLLEQARATLLDCRPGSPIRKALLEQALAKLLSQRKPPVDQAHQALEAADHLIPEEARPPVGQTGRGRRSRSRRAASSQTAVEVEAVTMIPEAVAMGAEAPAASAVVRRSPKTPTRRRHRGGARKTTRSGAYATSNSGTPRSTTAQPALPATGSGGRNSGP